MLAVDAIKAAVWHSTSYIQAHEYMLFRENPDAYRALLKMIKLHAKPEKFRGVTYRYWRFEGYKYWCIKDVINRSKV